jgi:hypothetical protein
MNRLTINELKNIRGGSVSGSLINAFARGIETLLSLGRSLGNAIRRIRENRFCKL